MKQLIALLSAAVLATTAWAQQHDNIGGGSQMNITAGYVSPSVLPMSVNFRNLLDNSAFNIYQRGTTALTGVNTTATYHADRWAGYANAGGASVTLTNVTSSLPVDFSNGENVKRASSNANLQPIFLVQEIPSADVIPLQGQQVCVSAYLLAGANFSAASSKITVQVITGTGTDQGLSSLLAATWTGQATTLNDSSQAITTTFVRYTPAVWCFTMPSSATEAAVQFGFTPVGTAGTDDSFTITGVQLEAVGQLAQNSLSVGQPGPYEFRSKDWELYKAQRYFLQITEANSFFGFSAACTATNTITAAVDLPIPMRAAPTGAITVGGFQAVINGAGAAGLSGQAAGTNNVNTLVITATNTCTAGQTVMIRGSGTTGKITATADF
jgi:hypothetical protein